MTETQDATTAEAAFAAALVEFQKELPHVKKDNKATVKSEKGSYSYAYADLTDITEVAVPLLTKHGLSWSACPTLTDAGFVLRYSLLHVAGHREAGDFPLPDPSRFSAQQIGSALTYARRYSLCAVTGIAPGGDDDDGKGAEGAVSADPLPRAPRRPNATTRRGQAEIGDPTQVSDEWTTPPLRVTDDTWLSGFRVRLAACGKPSELRGLREEANVMWAENKVADEDARGLKREMAERETELTAVPA